MKAVILAGGKGARLAPYTVVLPKPLMPVGDRPILEIILRQLRHHGITDVVLAVGYLAELLEAYFGDGRRFGVHIEYSREEKPLGTAGPLALIDGLDEPFLVMNGDLLTTLDYAKLAAHHADAGAACTIAMYRRQVQVTLGVMEVDPECRLLDYIEKPTYDYHVSMGAYVFDPRVLDYVEPGQYLDFPDLIKRLLRSGAYVAGYPFEGYWLDIGRHEDYAQAMEEFEKMRPSLVFEEAVDELESLPFGH
jgi:NDP-sugar pyrophosphorylase family protein